MTARVSVWSGLIVLAILNAADVWSTNHALTAKGVEGNPVARALMESGLLVAAKVAVVSLICLLSWHHRKTPPWLIAFVWLACGFYLSAVAGNLLVASA